MPVLPEPLEMLVYAQEPGNTEVEEGALVGPSGRLTSTALQLAGWNGAWGKDNAILCQSPGGDLDRFRTVCRKRGWVDPVDACRPHAQHSVFRARYAILMGAAALSSVGVSGAITSVRGTPVQVPGGPPAMPVLHASFVMRKDFAHLKPVFRDDVAKGVRISRTGSTWRDPSYFVASSADGLARFLAQPFQRVAIDTETDDLDPWTCNLRRVGLGTQREVAVYSPLSVTGRALLPAGEDVAQRRVIAEFVASARVPLVFHNFWQYDSIVLSRHDMPVDRAPFDSLLGHSKGVTSELPHGLDMLASQYTDIAAWKGKSKTDADLDLYLSRDVAVTDACAPHVWHNVVRTQQQPLYELDTRLAEIGRGMSALGIYVNRRKQYDLAVEYQTKAVRLRAQFIEACGREVNPRSVPQVQSLLYEDFGLPILEGKDYETGSGDPSTNETTLLALLELGLDRRATQVIHSLLNFRSADRVLSTYTGRIDEDTGALCGGPRIHADGRLRTGWNVGHASTGRWSSSDPVNLTNIPDAVRAMYEPASGHVFVARDFNALEMRIVALLSGDERLLAAFRAFDAGEGPDIHTANGCFMFGCDAGAVNKRIRTLVKRVEFGTNYGAAPPRIFAQIRMEHDDDFRPTFPDIDLPEVERVYRLYKESFPGLFAWREEQPKLWRRQGFLADAWHGRRRYFPGGMNEPEMYNFPIQGGAAALQNDAVLACVEAYPFDFERQLGLLLQVHDQNVLEVRTDDDDIARARMALTQGDSERGGMKFPGEIKIGSNWKEVS